VKIIGVTGGVGSGKSEIIHILEAEYSARIIEADKVAHFLMDLNTKTYLEIVEVFGNGILDDSQQINRKKLGDYVFNHQEYIPILNKIVHPRVQEYILEQIALERRSGSIDLFVIEAAILIETGYKDFCDELWYIYVEKEIRINRLIISRGYSREKCEAIMQSQKEDNFYIENCKYIIDNSKDIDTTRMSIEHILKSR